MENSKKIKKTINKPNKSNEFLKLTNNKNFKWVMIGLVLLCLTIATALAINSFKAKDSIESVNYNAVVSGGQAKVKTPYQASDPTIHKIFSIAEINKNGGLTLANGKQHTRDMDWIFETDTGVFVYCIELGVMADYNTNLPTNTSSSYWSNLSDTQKAGIEYATVFGFPNKTRDSYTNEIQYLVTQAIIWEFQQGFRVGYTEKPTVSTQIYDRIICKDSRLKAVYDSIIADMRQYTTVPSFAERNEANVVTNALAYNTKTKKYEGTFTDSNGVLKGLKVNCTGNIVCNKSEDGNSLIVTSAVPLTSAASMTFTKEVPKNQTQGKLVIDKAEAQKMLLGKPNINESVSYFKVSTEKLGKMLIQKESEDNIIKGAKFTITGPNGYKQENISTNDDGQIVLNNLKFGDYTITENVDTSKYESVPSQKITINESYVNTARKVTFKNTLKNNSTVKVTKVDKETGEAVVGATLVIKKGETVVDSWVSDGSLHPVKETLDLNTDYQLCETKAPAGYIAGGCQTFKVTSKNQNLTLKMENTKTKMYIRKVDPEGNDLKGAHLQVLELDGTTIVDEWDTDGQVHPLRGVTIGKEYILRETSVPAKYIKAPDKKFKAANETTVKMENIQTEIIISKTDLAGNEIGGAKLELLDSKNSLVHKWTSVAGKSETIRGLIVGAKYTLKETTAPDGYAVTESITFTVGDTNPTKIQMKNKPTKTIFRKTDATGKDEIAGARLQIIDPSNGNKVVEEWVSEEGKTKEITKLTEGHSYILKEITAPDGYVLSEEVPFVVGETAIVEMKNEVTETIIEKRDLVSNEKVNGATLQLVDNEGQIIDEWISSDEPKVIYKLSTGVEYTIKEIEVPEKYEASEPVKFTISASENQKVIIVYDKPIVDVPNTAVDISTQTLIIGMILLIGGAGTVVWIKKRA